MNDKITRKQRAEQHTRDAILSSSVIILQKHGLKDFTMDKVAEEAELSKGSLYRYFKNKNELIHSTADHCFKPLCEDIHQIFASDICPLQKLEQYVAASYRHTEQNKKLFYDIKTVLLSQLEKEFNDRSSGYWETINIISKTFQEGVDRKLLRPMDTDKVAIFLIDSIDRAIIRRIISTVDDSAEDDARELLNIYLHGLAI